ncbi:MAG: amidohydrolase family protein, partial [Myxococcota bacterium]
VRKLAKAGVDFIKLIDQDKMTPEEAQAVVDEAHKQGLRVVAHGHRPDEIRVGLAIGVDNFEHTGLATAPAYPPDVIAALKERTAAGMIHQGPLFWTPTVSGLFNYQYVRDNPELLDTDCYRDGLRAETADDIKRSLKYPERLPYFQITPQRAPTLRRKINQLRAAGVVFLVGTDSGIPLKFHCQSTWNELDILVREMGMDPYSVIKSATYWPAVFVGKDKDLGTVSEGKLADIIAVKGDVIRYINLLQNVDFVMKGGVIYKGGPTTP